MSNRELCKDARKARGEFLKESAEYAAKLIDTVTEKEIRSIIEIERQREQSQRINKVLRRRHGGGPNSILIPAITEYDIPYGDIFYHYDIDRIWERIEIHNGEDIDNWERVTDQRLVVDMLLKWQQKHFAQATETPFSNEYWKEQLQDRNIQQALIDGTFPIPNDLPLEAQELLAEMRKPTLAIGEIRSFTTYEDFREYIKRIDEKNHRLLRGDIMVTTRPCWLVMRNT